MILVVKLKLKKLQCKMPEKVNCGLSRIRTHDPCVTGATLYELSYEARHWEQGQG